MQCKQGIRTANQTELIKLRVLQAGATAVTYGAILRETERGASLEGVPESAFEFFFEEVRLL